MQGQFPEILLDEQFGLTYIYLNTECFEVLFEDCYHFSRKSKRAYVWNKARRIFFKF